jgi:predicted MFS family arabinose efflux permease
MNPCAASGRRLQSNAPSLPRHVTPSSPPPSPEPAAPTPLPSLHATVFLLAVAGFFGGAALRICDGLLPRLAHDFSTTAGAAGQVVLVFSIAYAAMQLVFGPLGDRFGKARLMMVALVGCALLSLLAALAQSLPQLLAARVGWGMAAAGVVPLAIALIGDSVPYEERQATLARLLMGTLSGMVGGQLAGGLFADAGLGWRGAFLVMAVGYGLIAALLLSRLRHFPVPPRPAGNAFAVFGRQVSAVLGVRWTWWVLAATFAEGVFLLGPLAYIPAMLHQRFGLALSAASALVALYAVGGLVYAVGARHFVRRLGERRMVRAGGWIMGAGYLLWLLSPIGWTAAPVALAVGFGTYLYHNTLQTHATQLAPSARGTAVALFAFCLFMGQAVGVSLAGWSFDHAGMAALLLPPALAMPIAGELFARAQRRRAAAG